MIRPLALRDVPQVAALHQHVLRTRLTGATGRALLRCRYEALTAATGGHGYVVESADGRLAGFVCGIWAPQRVRAQLLRVAWGRLLWWGGLHILTHPWAVMAALWGRVASGGESHPCDIPVDVGYELRPIAVEPPYQGGGIANQLLARLVEDAATRGHAAISLATETNNGRANRFYMKHGFVLTGASGGYNRYRLTLSQGGACP